MCANSRTIDCKTSVSGSPEPAQAQVQPGTLEILGLAGLPEPLHFLYILFCELANSGSGGCPGTLGFPGAGLLGLPARLSRGRRGKV